MYLKFSTRNYRAAG